MIIEQFHKEFKVHLDKTDSSSYPEFLPQEIDIYLNTAIDRFVKTRYGQNNIYRAGFEESQKRTDDLKNLVKSGFCKVSLVDYYTLTGQKIYRADLGTIYTDEAASIAGPDVYMLFLKCGVKSKIGTCQSYIDSKLVQQDDIEAVKGDPFNKPRSGKALSFFEDGDLFVWVAPEASVEAVLLTYLKKPAQVCLGSYGKPKVECDLNEHTHKEILQIAIQIALENIGSPRTQTQELVNVQKVE
jgi:hypothetical protein